jgi:hypothetical protein
MKRLSTLSILFAVTSLAFFVLITFLKAPFFLYSLMSTQDAVDILTPLVMIPIYGALFWIAGKTTPGQAGIVAFLVLVGLWVEGQGVHLSANSINTLASSAALRPVVDISKTPLYELVYFFDEHLGHILWHLGVVGLVALMVFREWRSPSGQSTAWWAAILAGIVYGFNCFCIFIEGQTAALGLPFVAAVVLWTLVWGRRELSQRPVQAFFFISCLFALVLFAVWFLMNGGLPQFTEVGLI